MNVVELEWCCLEVAELKEFCESEGFNFIPYRVQVLVLERLDQGVHALSRNVGG